MHPACAAESLGFSAVVFVHTQTNYMLYKSSLSINLVLLGEACFTVHIKMGVDWVLPDLIYLWLQCQCALRKEFKGRCLFLLDLFLFWEGFWQSSELDELSGEKQPTPNHHSLCPPPGTWAVWVHRPQLQGQWQGKAGSAAKAMHLTSNTVLGSTCVTRGAWGLD